MTQEETSKVVTRIGNIYPFYNSNVNLGKSYYLYRVISPRILNDLTPLLSLEKVGEKVDPFYQYSASKECMNDMDIIATLLKSRKNIETESVNYLKNNIFKRFNENIEIFQDTKNMKKFPCIKLDEKGENMKVLIATLRDNLRWSTYRFNKGQKIDVLTDNQEFTVFEIEGDNETLSIKPIATYSNVDCEMKEPKEVKQRIINYFKGKVFTGKTRVSDLNRFLRLYELRVLDQNNY